MSNDKLALLQKLGLGSAPAITQESLNEMGCDGASFLPRLELMTASKELFKTGKYRGAMNAWVIVETGGSCTPIDVVAETVLITWRSFAMDFQSKNRFYDPTSDGFKDIQKRADFPKAKCGVGPQFLVYIPSLNKCAIWWANNKSSKFAWNGATAAYNPGNGGSYNGLMLEFKSKLHNFKEGAQMVPELTFKVDRDIDLTDFADVVADGIKKFNADMEQAAQNDEATATDGRAR